MDAEQSCSLPDEITSPSEWVSVIVIVKGGYDELRDPQHSVERAHAREVLEKQHRWWLDALAG
jgi:nitroimidazol reductase NimA-like FMN-containing flavoprotein (pyridoxamine 5'-phosphate oxidase superfamily)